MWATLPKSMGWRCHQRKKRRRNTAAAGGTTCDRKIRDNAMNCGTGPSKASAGQVLKSHRSRFIGCRSVTSYFVQGICVHGLPLWMAHMGLGGRGCGVLCRGSDTFTLSFLRRYCKWLTLAQRLSSSCPACHSRLLRNLARAARSFS
jgi:hypothetical protein